MAIHLTKERKVLLIGGVILLVAGFLYRFPLSLSTFDSGEEITLKQKAIIKYKDSLQEKNALQKNLIALEKLKDQAEAVLIIRQTASLAAVDIQNQLQNFAGRANVEVNTMQVLPPQKTADEIYLAVPVKFTIKASMRQLKEILYQIENASFLFHIEDLNIKDISRPPADSLVNITMTVTGYMPAPLEKEGK